MLNTLNKEIFERVIKDLDYFNLSTDAKALSEKQIIMLDEHPLNKEIADAIKSSNRSYFYLINKFLHSLINKESYKRPLVPKKRIRNHYNLFASVQFIRLECP